MGRLVDVPGGHIHLVEEGSGPLVLLVHGFPESSLSWRHQLPALAAAAFHAVAMDVRGYGDSFAPGDVQDYRMVQLVADVVGVIEELGEQPAVLVGHDWGSPIAASTALLRPDLVRALALLSVPYAPPGGPRPSEAFANLGGDETFYISHFQVPGLVEEEAEADLRGWLRAVFAGLSAEFSTRAAAPWFMVPHGGGMLDRLPAEGMPAWLTEEALDAYAAGFDPQGITPALNRYRNMDRDWEDLAAWRGRPIPQPSLFVGGRHDATTTWMATALAAHPQTLPGLMGSHLLDCGHWVQQERAEEVNALLLGWLAGLPA